MNADQLRANGWVEQPNGIWSKSTKPALARVNALIAASVIKPKKRIRQKSGDDMNKLERELWSHLKERFPNHAIRPQAKRYRLTSGMTYTPDFTCVVNGVESAWECKGPRAWEDSIVKLKAAAALWPEVVFWLCWKEDGEWRKQVVLP